MATQELEAYVGKPRPVRPPKPHNTNKGKQIAWDKDLEYLATKKYVTDMIVMTRAEARDPDDPFAFKRLAGYEGILIGLNNGARVSESYRALVDWAKNGNPVVNVKISKKRPPCTCGHIKTSNNPIRGHVVLGPGERGKCKSPTCSCKNYAPNLAKYKTRETVIPAECLEEDLPLLRQAIERWIRTKRKPGVYPWQPLESFAKDHVKNFHAMRYSYVGKMIDDGVDPVSISKNLGQESLDLVIKYQQKRRGLQAQRLLSGRLGLTK